MTRWFRFYDDTINDPKILKLSDRLYRVWTGMLCLASKNNGVLPQFDDMVIMLRTKAEKLHLELEQLIKSGLLDHSDAGIAPHNWNARQYKSDVSTDRVKRFRQQQRNVSETPPETETETETETEAEIEKKKVVADATPTKTKADRNGSRISPDWQLDDDGRAFANSLGLDPDSTSQEFRDWWLAKAGPAGTKADWPATWRNWCRRSASGVYRPARSGKGGFVGANLDEAIALAADIHDSKRRRPAIDLGLPSSLGQVLAGPGSDEDGGKIDGVSGQLVSARFQR